MTEPIDVTGLAAAQDRAFHALWDARDAYERLMAANHQAASAARARVSEAKRAYRAAEAACTAAQKAAAAEALSAPVAARP